MWRRRESSMLLFLGLSSTLSLRVSSSLSHTFITLYRHLLRWPSHPRRLAFYRVCSSFLRIYLHLLFRPFPLSRCASLTVPFSSPRRFTLPRKRSNNAQREKLEANRFVPAVDMRSWLMHAPALRRNTWIYYEILIREVPKHCALVFERRTPNGVIKFEYFFKVERRGSWLDGNPLCNLTSAWVRGI